MRYAIDAFREGVPRTEIAKLLQLRGVQAVEVEVLLERASVYQLQHPNCSTLSSNSEVAGCLITQPLCHIPTLVPGATSDEDNASNPTTPKWLILTSVGLIALGVGMGGGFVLGHRHEPPHVWRTPS